MPSVWEMLGKGYEEVSHKTPAFTQYQITHTTHILREATEHGTGDQRPKCIV